MLADSDHPSSSPDLRTVSASLLPPPRIRGAATGKQPTFTPADCTRQTRFDHSRKRGWSNLSSAICRHAQQSMTEPASKLLQSGIP